MIKTKSTFLALVAVLLSPMAANAVPIVWDFNGHSYELIASGGITWQDASDAAEGMGGYLATITSDAENEFIVSMLGIGQSPYWLGGFQAPGSSEPDTEWQWVTGEAWGYTNWASGEPNDAAGEDALAFAFFADVGQWNDAPVDYLYGNGGYVVEYKKVPEPGTLALFGLGLFGMGLAKRKKI